MCPCKACKRQECHILRAEKSDQLSEALAKWRIDPERVKGTRPCHKRTFDKKPNMQSKKQNACDQITKHQDCRKETTTTNSLSVYRRQHKPPKPPQQSKHGAPKTCHFFAGNLERGKGLRTWEEDCSATITKQHLWMGCNQPPGDSAREREAVLIKSLSRDKQGRMGISWFLLPPQVRF